MQGMFLKKSIAGNSRHPAPGQQYSSLFFLENLYFHLTRKTFPLHIFSILYTSRTLDLRASTPHYELITAALSFPTMKFAKKKKRKKPDVNPTFLLAVTLPSIMPNPSCEFNCTIGSGAHVVSPEDGKRKLWTSADYSSDVEKEASAILW